MSDSFPDEIVRERLSRLGRLQGSDPGFFMLSVHSFIEAWLRERYRNDRKTTYLKDLLWDFRRELREKARFTREQLRVLDEIDNAHDLTNAVRHGFKALEVEEARAATTRFMDFCKLAGIHECKELQDLSSSLRLWEERSSRLEDIQKINKLSIALGKERADKAAVDAELKNLLPLKAEYTKLSGRLKSVEEELDTEKGLRKDKSARNDELRQEKAKLKDDMRSLEGRIEELSKANEYVLDLTRLTLYTRSRIDYERELARLTPDQQQILDEITLVGDFLIKGGAGTGKTLVLLKALEKLVTRAEGTLFEGADRPSFMLLTYSETLVKYDRYVAGIISIAEREERILSVDEYLLQKLAAATPGACVDDDGFAAIVKRLSDIDFLPPDGVIAELEEFLFANDVSEREYCVDLIDRAGMGRRIDPKQRRRLWELRAKVVEAMEAEGVFSRNYSRTRLIRTCAERSELRTEDYLFIDEVQDLSPADLMALKAIARRAVIMAGDNDQAIFRRGFSFKRAGIDIVGKSRTIKLNFRNTLQINELAERYRKRIAGSEDGGPAIGSAGGKLVYERPCQAFRPGPPPERFFAPDTAGLEERLVERVRTFIELLGYEPETLTVLVPDGEALEQAHRLLAETGYAATAIDAPDFRFESTKGIRLSTLHLAKGIDFPVVLLYLPRLPNPVAGYDGAFNEAMFRNLVYVCMTRAMEQLSIFTLDRPKEPAIAELAAAFEELST